MEAGEREVDRMRDEGSCTREVLIMGVEREVERMGQTTERRVIEFERDSMSGAD